MSVLPFCCKYFVYGCCSVPAAGGCSEGPGTRTGAKVNAEFLDLHGSFRILLGFICIKNLNFQLRI